MTRQFPLFLMLGLLVLTGCASNRADDEMVADRVCVRVREIHDYDAIDDRHVVVEARHGDYYLFTLDDGCRGVTFAQGIEIRDAMSRVCSDGVSWLTFDHADGGSRRCQIVTIDQVEDVEAAKALIDEREGSWMD